MLTDFLHIGTSVRVTSAVHGSFDAVIAGWFNHESGALCYTLRDGKPWVYASEVTPKS